MFLFQNFQNFAWRGCRDLLSLVFCLGKIINLMYNQAVSLAVVIEASNKRLNRGDSYRSIQITRLLAAKVRYNPLNNRFLS